MRECPPKLWKYWEIHPLHPRNFPQLSIEYLYQTNSPTLVYKKYIHDLLAFTGKRNDINELIFRDHIIQYTPCSVGSVLGNTAQGTVFLDTLRDSLANTGTHPCAFFWRCSSNDANRHNVDICRKA